MFRHQLILVVFEETQFFLKHRGSTSVGSPWLLNTMHERRNIVKRAGGWSNLRCPKDFPKLPASPTGIQAVQAPKVRCDPANREQIPYK